MPHRAKTIPFVGLHSQDAHQAPQLRFQPSVNGIEWGQWLLPAGLFLVGLLAFLIDVPFAYWIVELKGLYFLRRTLQSAEPFGEAAGVVLVLAGIYVLDPIHRRCLPRILVASLGAGLVANIGKLFVARIRPYKLDFEDVTHCWQTFTGWLPLVGVSSQFQSFPSAHTATAAAFAVVLATIYSRGTMFFPCIAFLVALQRVETGAHYVSDVLFGCAVGLCFANLCVGRTRLAQWFDQFETGLPRQPEFDNDAPQSIPLPKIGAP